MFRVCSDFRLLNIYFDVARHEHLGDVRIGCPVWDEKLKKMRFPVTVRV